LATGLRRRFGGAQPEEPTEEEEGEAEEEEPDVPWTAVDWVILAVKFLIWMTFQFIFAKVWHTSDKFIRCDFSRSGAC
jgi:hypothetical protein